MSIAGINGYNYSNYYTGTKRNTAKANGMNSVSYTHLVDQLGWVRKMNSIRSRAEEVVLHDLIYMD